MSSPRAFGNRSRIATLVLVALAFSMVALAILQWLPWGINHSASRRFLILAQLVSVPFLLVAFHYRQALTRLWRSALVVATLAIIAACAVHTASIMYANVIDPPEWDFKLFWLYGRAGAQGLNPYNATLLRQLARTLNPSDGFLAELYFFYLPPTLFLFVPLGWFDIHTALLLWYMAQVAVLILDMVLLWRIFLRKDGLMGLALTVALMLTLRSTQSTIWHAQLNFLVLLMVLLFWRDRECERGGIWLALGILIKPVLVFLPLYLFLRRHWQVVAGTIVTLAVLSAVTVIAFGPKMLLDYITANPIANDMPGYMYTEAVNQSLLATILRLTEYDFTNTSPFTQPVFIILALSLTGVTTWFVFRLSRADADWALALTLSFALLIFPKTLSHYSALLIVPLLLGWVHRHVFLGSVWRVAAFITLEYALISYRNGMYAFFAFALAWLMLAGFAARRLAQQAIQPNAQRGFFHG